MDSMSNSDEQKRREKRLLSVVHEKPLIGPSSVSIHPTNACQLNCVGCWHYSPLLTSPRTMEWKRQNISLEKYKELIKDLVEMESESVVFSGGGDPLAHPDIVQFVALASENGLTPWMLSNLLLSKDPKALAKAGLKYVVSNCSAGSPEVYVNYHPNQDEKSFYKFTDIVKELVSYGVRIELNCVICNVNYKDIGNMLKLAAETSKVIRFKNMHLRESQDRGLIEALLSVEQLKELKDFVQNEYIALADSLSLDHNLREYLNHLDSSYDGSHNFPIEKINCYVGYYATAIRANGNVVICCHSPTEGKDLVIGNIHENSFKEIWLSDKYQEIRDRLAKRKYFDFCKYCEYYAYYQSNRDYTYVVEKIRENQKHKNSL